MNIFFLCPRDYMTRERAGLMRSLEEKCAVSFLDRFRNTSEEIQSLFADGEWPDLAIAPDIHKAYLPSGIEQLPFPTACFQIDAYSASKNRVSMSRLFDLVLPFHPYSAAVYSCSHPDVRSFPHAVPVEPYKNQSLSEVYDVSTIGRLDGEDYEYRRRAVDALSAMEVFTNDMTRYHPYHEMVETYSKSKITVNVSRGAYLDLAHLSCIEIMGAGTLLLTTSDPEKKRPHELSELGFVQGEHFDTFRNIKEMKKKIRYYLDKDTERRKMTRGARERVIAEHTSDQRAACLLNWIREGIPLQAPARSMSTGDVESIYLDYFSKRGKVDQTLNHLRKQRIAGTSTSQFVKSVGQAAKATVRKWQQAFS